IDLSTRYLGLFLRSPLVASASPLTGRIETLRQLEAAGAGAVVLPSLFEEEIVAESLALHAVLQRGTSAFHDSVTPYPAVSSAENAVDAHLRLVEEAKRTLTIPVIASLNATTPGSWARYAKLLELAGADALELNLYAVQTDPHRSGAEVESAYLEIVRDVADAISVPLSVKLSPYFSSLAEMARRVVLAGADGLVLFNRFYQPDLDVETLQVIPRVELSTSASLRLPLRWVGILRGRLDASLAATSGVHTAADVAKVLLVGADVAMMASVLLRQGPEHLWQIEAELRQWMGAHDYASVGDMRGSASQKAASDPAAFERANYVTALTSYQVPADMLYT
ncbi:MAG: dihydroorotate dehydrogenase-like protein, partial [Mycobacterium leprae]